MIYDIFTFNGELDLLEIRLNILSDYVDQFIIVEATETFSGKPKELYYEKNKERYKKWENKIKYHIVRPPYDQRIVAMANGSPNTQGAEHWKREFCQKESIKDALTHLKDNDTVFIGDVDEIWDSITLHEVSPRVVRKLKLRVFTYYLNNRSSEQFWGTIKGMYIHVKDTCLNHLRTNAVRTDKEYGYHFTSMGGYEEVKRKLSDSYTRDSYWTEQVESNLKDNVEKSMDFLGRGFSYFKSELLPDYIINNKDKYKHLWRN